MDPPEIQHKRSSQRRDSFLRSPIKPTSVRLVEAKEALKPLDSIFDEMNNTVDNLGSKIGEIVHNKNKRVHHAYEVEMKAKYKDLVKAKIKYEEHILAMTKDGQLKKLEGELEYYRIEALKHSKILEEKDNQIKALKQEVKILKDEKSFLQEYVSQLSKKIAAFKPEQNPDESGNIIKASVIKPPTHSRSQRLSIHSRRKTSEALIQEDDSKSRKNIGNKSFEATSKTLNNDKVKTKELEAFLVHLQAHTFDNRDLLIKEIENFYKEIISSYETKLSNNRRQIYKDRVSSASQSQLQLQRETTKDLLSFFDCCINDVRNDIIKRKVFTKNSFAKTSNRSYIWPSNKEDFDHVQYSDFSLGDKQKFLELFIFNSSVLSLIKYALNPAPKEKVERSGIYELTATKSKIASKTSVDFSDILDLLDDEPNSHPISATSIGEIKARLSRPKTVGTTNIDLSALPRIIEIDKEVLPSEGVSAGSRTVMTKFSQLKESNHVPSYKPKGEKLTRNIGQTYKF